MVFFRLIVWYACYRIVYETMPELRFPPRPMTANTTDMSLASYGKGTYVASASSQTELPPDRGAGETRKWAYFAFDRVVDNDDTGWEANHWHSDNIADGPQWIRLDMPVSVRVTKYALHSRDSDGYAKTDFPNDFVLEGSEDGVSWSSIDSRFDQAKTVFEPFARNEYSVDTSAYHSKVRLRVTSVGPDGKGRNRTGVIWNKVVVLPEIELYGVMFSSPRSESDAHGPIWNFADFDSNFFDLRNGALYVYGLVVVAIVAIVVYVAWRMKKRSTPRKKG